MIETRGAYDISTIRTFFYQFGKKIMKQILSLTLWTRMVGTASTVCHRSTYCFSSNLNNSNIMSLIILCGTIIFWRQPWWCWPSTRKSAKTNRGREQKSVAVSADGPTTKDRGEESHGSWFSGRLVLDWTSSLCGNGDIIIISSEKRKSSRSPCVWVRLCGIIDSTSGGENSLSSPTTANAYACSPLRSCYRRSASSCLTWRRTFSSCSCSTTTACRSPAWWSSVFLSTGSGTWWWFARGIRWLLQLMANCCTHPAGVISVNVPLIFGQRRRRRDNERNIGAVNEV